MDKITFYDFDGAERSPVRIREENHRAKEEITL